MLSKIAILGHAISLFKSLSTTENKKQLKEGATETVSKVRDTVKKENKQVSRILKTLVRYPLKTIGLYIMAPFFLLRVIFKVPNKWRKFTAILGLIVSTAVSYAAGTFLGSVAGFIFVTNSVGIIYGLGFLFGTLLSTTLTILFCILTFNLVASVFLKISTSQIIGYLEEMSN